MLEMRLQILCILLPALLEATQLPVPATAQNELVFPTELQKDLICYKAKDSPKKLLWSDCAELAQKFARIHHHLVGKHVLLFSTIPGLGGVLPTLDSWKSCSLRMSWRDVVPPRRVERSEIWEMVQALSVISLCTTRTPPSDGKGYGGTLYIGKRKKILVQVSATVHDQRNSDSPSVGSTTFPQDFDHLEPSLGPSDAHSIIQDFEDVLKNWEPYTPRRRR